ncbi:hypothetical protein G6F40_012837 [Rhizopus arrhizus]|nr:hypothetical protein G6F40_012837 [Rhizopus arrhizus]
MKYTHSGVLRRNALALSLACAASPALAQDTAPATTELDRVMVTQRTEGYQVYGTNTATKLPLTLRETPQSLTVFTRQRIEDFNLITISEVLQQTPGVTIQSSMVVPPTTPLAPAATRSSATPPSTNALKWCAAPAAW